MHICPASPLGLNIDRCIIKRGDPQKPQKFIERNLKYNWNVFINTKTSPFMCVTMITFLCPFLLESPRLNLKLLWKLGIYSKLFIFKIALLHISNENTAYLFEITIYTIFRNKDQADARWHWERIRLISYGSQTRWGTPPFYHCF